MALGCNALVALQRRGELCPQFVSAYELCWPKPQSGVKTGLTVGSEGDTECHCDGSEEKLVVRSGVSNASRLGKVRLVAKLVAQRDDACAQNVGCRSTYHVVCERWARGGVSWRSPYIFFSICGQINADLNL